MVDAEDQETRRRIGERLKLRRERLDRERGGYSQENIARRVGMARETISNYERGTRAISAEDLLKLARALRTTCAWILGEERDDDQAEQDYIVAYRGAPPPAQAAALAVLRSMHREDDLEN